MIGIDLAISGNVDVKDLPDSGFTKNWNEYFNIAFQGKTLRVEETVHSDNKTEYFEIILNPIRHEDNQIFGVGCFARDITQRKETENKIKEQVEKLEKVAWIQSHEVRKPLANILGLLNLIKKEKDPAQSSELIDHMDASCKELDAVIKKVVETSTTGNSSST